MTKRISSAWTACYKIGFPLFYAVGMAFHSYIFTTRLDNQELYTVVLAVMGASYVTGALFILWLGRFYKHVELDQSGLNITGYFVSDFVPFSRIEKIEQSRWLSGRPVYILLKEDSPFGTKIAFQTRGTAPMFGEHPIVKELRLLAGIPEPKSDARRPRRIPPPLPKQMDLR